MEREKGFKGASEKDDQGGTFISLENPVSQNGNQGTGKTGEASAWGRRAQKNSWSGKMAECFENGNLGLVKKRTLPASIQGSIWA